MIGNPDNYPIDILLRLRMLILTKNWNRCLCEDGRKTYVILPMKNDIAIKGGNKIHILFVKWKKNSNVNSRKKFWYLFVSEIKKVWGRKKEIHSIMKMFHHRMTLVEWRGRINSPFLSPHKYIW